jgi:hypothetical protein
MPGVDVKQCKTIEEFQWRHKNWGAAILAVKLALYQHLWPDALEIWSEACWPHQA